jgi:pimeloyl-ACP methyl ester carboxylesterase
MPVLETQFADLSTGVRLAYVRVHGGDYPLLLLHGFPETKRIWWRNLAPLAAAGFDVIAPDLRGYGESSFAPDGHYDPAAFATDLHALIAEALQVERVSVVAGDLGAAVAIDFSFRFPGMIERLCLINHAPPSLPEAYAAAGIPPSPALAANPVWDYVQRQGTEGDRLLEELDTPERRRRYVAEFYGHRLWGVPGAFSAEETDFMSEPFAEAERLRASFVDYEVVCGKKLPLAPERLSEPVELPTLILYGPEDHVVPRTFPQMCRVAYPQCIGPFVVPGAGHFLQWEQAEVLNRAVAYFFADLRGRG